MVYFKLSKAFTWSEESHKEYPEKILKLLASEYMQDTQ
jgi:hypothetical protein